MKFEIGQIVTVDYLTVDGKYEEWSGTVVKSAVAKSGVEYIVLEVAPKSFRTLHVDKICVREVV